MSFDPRSLERLRDLGRQLPQKLPDPEHPQPASSKPSQKQHKVETEQNPEALFRELMQISPDGTVPEHLMARLKELETRNDNQDNHQRTNASEQPTDLPALPKTNSGKGKTTRPNHPQVVPGSEEESLYIAFGQMMLEDEEDNT